LQLLKLHVITLIVNGLRHERAIFKYLVFRRRSEVLNELQFIRRVIAFYTGSRMALSRRHTSTKRDQSNQRIRCVTTMRSINLHFTYLLTYKVKLLLFKRKRLVKDSQHRLLTYLLTYADVRRHGELTRCRGVSFVLHLTATTTLTLT